MRTYLFNASRPGGFMFWPGKTVTTQLRIRAAVVLMFRKWFGTEPDEHWHKDGFMAEARDLHGNCVQLEQFNQWCPFQSGGDFLPVKRTASDTLLDQIARQLEAA